MVKKNISVIIQARYNSTRFPGKILKKINNLTLLEILIKRLLRSKKINNLIIACTQSKHDDEIINICKKYNVKTFRGSETNVQLRYYLASKKFKVDNIIRITSDCPLIDHRLMDILIDKFFSGNYDYLSNTIKPTYPDGMDIEIFKSKLIDLKKNSKNSSLDKEHVTPSFHDKKKYKIYNFISKKNYSNLRLTVDTKEDLNFLKNLLEKFNYNYMISLKKILDFSDKNKNFFTKFKFEKRNLGTNLNLGQKYWRRANDVIPGGTMLFSKNPDLHLPERWPAYFSRAKGINIWDLENKKYKDIFLMGIGTNTLGYSYQPVENKIKQSLFKSNMSSLNSIEEIFLAEKLLDMHKWAEKARFTRSGGEANAVAIRIARAYSIKSNIAICGYHGWHDWYLSTNLSDKKNLDSHLMKNLSINGVPRNLKNTVFPFEYNNFKQLKRLVEDKNIGIIKMEVERNYVPKNNFLKKIRKLCDKKNIILIFDECTSGFRGCFGGLHLNYNVNPDILILGKALGNGYAINAVLGKKDIMDASKKTFISSTFWTERIGPIAALETLKQMEKIKSWKLISATGKKIKKNWLKISKNNGLKINVQGLDALPNFVFKSKNHNAYKSYISQEMVKKRILASNTVYTCISHDDKGLKNYYDILNNIFKNIKRCEDEREKISNLLDVDEGLIGIRGK